MTPAFSDLFHRHIAAVFERQQRLGDLISEEGQGLPFAYTISKAELVFGKRLRFTALDLGSHAAQDGSWLWSWCDPSLKLTRENKRLAEEVRRLASTAGVPEFGADAQFDCAELIGAENAEEAAHAIASVVAGELGFDAYYRIPFSDELQGIALIRDERLRIPSPHPFARIASVFTEVICDFSIPDQRAALISYLRWHALAVEESAEAVRVVVDGEEELKATFDDRNLLVKLETRIRPTR